MFPGGRTRTVYLLQKYENRENIWKLIWNFLYTLIHPNIYPETFFMEINHPEHRKQPPLKVLPLSGDISRLAFGITRQRYPDL